MRPIRALRGPVIAGAIRQFWSETSWGPLDYLLVDMPPGTADVALTVFQSLPVDGIVIVTSPQDLVSMIVAKAVNMAEKMNIPVLGVVENMAYVECPDCGKKLEVFGPSKLDEVAARYDLDILGRLPINPAFAAACDAGAIETDLPGGLLPRSSRKWPPCRSTLRPPRTPKWPRTPPTMSSSSAAVPPVSPPPSRPHVAVPVPASSSAMSRRAWGCSPRATDAATFPMSGSTRAAIIIPMRLARSWAPIPSATLPHFSKASGYCLRRRARVGLSHHSARRIRSMNAAGRLRAYRRRDAALR